MTRTTTDKHLAAFAKEASKWIDRLKLNDWETVFVRKPLDDSRAAMFATYTGRTAVFVLAAEWTDPAIPLNIETVKSTAKHEALELLVFDLFFVGRHRFSTEDEIDHARHVLVTRLQNIL